MDQQSVDALIEKDTSDLMDLSFSCSCGKNHRIPIKYISMKNEAIEEIKSKRQELGISGEGILIYDKKIEEIVVNRVISVLNEKGLISTVYPVGDGLQRLPAEIELSKRISDDIKGKGDYLISVGSGVISDLTKYAAHLLDLPYILVATAPSMNGYTSSMAALTDRGIKKTLMIDPAMAIFADIDILKSSPIEMVRAGLGDIVSKSICSADWKLSQIVKNTYFCPLPFHITDKSELLYLDAAEEIGKRTDYGIAILTDGIMRSGLSMTIIGTSTPSSGAEHLLSHYWDLIALKDGKEKFLHGVQVGVATIIMLKIYDFIKNYPIKILSIESLKNHYPSKEDIEAYIDQKFGKYAEGVKGEYFEKYMDWKAKRRELECVIDNWNQIWNELDCFIRPSGPVENALKKGGAAAYYNDLGKTKEEVYDSLLNARLMRGRYTILDLASDLDILDKAASKIME